MRDLEEILKPYLPEHKIAPLVAYQTKSSEPHGLVSILEEDFNTIKSELAVDPDSQFLRRTMIRTFFAVVEGAIYALKDLIKIQSEFGYCDLRPKEYEKLIERELDDDGKPTSTNKFLKLKDNIKFAFHIYAEKAGGILFEFDFGSGWAAFLDAIKIRDHLMHPKSRNRLPITDSDLATVETAHQWFNEHWNRLLSDVKSAIRRSTQAHIADVSIKPLRESFARAFAREQSFEIDKETPVILLPPDFEETNYTVQNPTEEQASVEAVELKHYPYKDEVILMGYSSNLNILVMTEPESLAMQYRKLRALFITG
jgi:hypothetical protein